MAVKTFTTGEVLTAADTNTYLNNGGLVYVKSQTVGAAVSSVTVSSAFDATYDNYRIIYTGGTASADCAIGLQLGASATGYYAGLARVDSTAAASFLANSNATSWAYAGMGSTDAATVDIELFDPYNARFTRSKLSWMDTRTSNAWGQGTGVHRVATSYTAFTLTPSAGTLTGGTITVYGYRKA